MFGKQEPETKKVNISELAHITTLSEEEREELETSGEVQAEDATQAVFTGSEAANGTGDAKEIKRIEHTGTVYSFAAKPDRRTMYDFMMYHSYVNVLGVISILIGIGAITMVVISLVQKTDLLQIILFLAVAVMFLSNSPITLWFKAKKQSDLISAEENTITYTFSDAGFDMSRGTDEYADFEWNHMYKVKEGTRGFYMYIEKNRAFVIPKEDVTDMDGFKALLKAHVEKRLILNEESAK